jgi:hypothetical protein
MKDGWLPLCEFLGRPKPVEPFPRLNETEVMNEKIAVIAVTGIRMGVWTVFQWVLVFQVPLTMAAWWAWWLLRSP